MRILLFSNLLPIFLLLQLSQSQWQSANGPYPVGAGILSISSNNIYVFNSTSTLGILRAPINGTGWTRINSGLPWLNVYQVTAFSNTLYATSYESVAKSTNNGDNWSVINLPNTYFPLSLLHTPTSLLVGTQNHGIFRTTNEGASWDYQLTGGSIRGFAEKTGTSDVYAASNLGIFKSVNDGYTWIGVSANSTYCIAISGNIFYAGRAGGIYRSVDGITWNFIPLTSASFIVNSITSYQGNIYAGADDGLYASADGISWQKVTSPLTNTSIKFLYAALNDNLYGGTSLSGCIKDASSQWSYYNEGLPVLGIEYIFAGSENVIAANAGVFIQQNNSNTWQKTFETPLNLLQKNRENYYGQAGQVVLKSSDNGSSWHTFAKNTDQKFCVSGDTLFKGIAGDDPMPHLYIYRSTDFGINWQWLSSIYGQTSFTGFYVHETSGGDIIYALPFVYSSTDKGYTWSIAWQGLSSNIKGMISENDSLYVYTAAGIFYRQNNSVWIPLNGNLNNVNIHAAAVYSYGLFVSNDEGVFRSEDHGVTWKPLGTAGSQTATTLAVNNNYLYAGTDSSGVWKYPLHATVGTGNNGNTIPETFYLYQNYPNPFNPATKIKIDIPKITGGDMPDVKLEIFNITGKSAGFIVNQKLNPGRYEFVWNASLYASGIYFYKITVAHDGKIDFIDAKKMVLSK